MDINQEGSDEETLLFVAAVGQHILNMNAYNSAILRLYCFDQVQASGLQTVIEMLDRHPCRCYDRWRMTPRNFRRLADEIAPLGNFTADVAIEEQLAIFLHIIGHGTTVREAGEIYQRSTETVHRCFKNILRCVIRLESRYMSIPGVDTPRHQLVRDTPFKDALGAIDGSYIPVYVDKSKIDGDEEMKKKRVELYRNRKGLLSQNVLAAVDFDMQFVYLLAGFEGSAHDSEVLRVAQTRKFTVPSGRYYLGDSGYANRRNFICPYRKEIYHLAQFRACRQSNNYLNPDEMFNHRHAQLRNIVEMAFEVLKDRFKILKVDRPYKHRRQSQIILACCILHNFLKRQNQDNNNAAERVLQYRDSSMEFPQSPTEISSEEEDGIDPWDMVAGDQIRTSIRDALWQSRVN